MKKPKPKKQKEIGKVILPDMPEPPSKEEWDKKIKTAETRMLKRALKARKKKKQKAKPVYAWCIKYRGTLAFETCNFRNKCISFFTDKMNNRMQLFSSHIDDWPSLKKEGYRCVKVKIEEV